MLQAKGSLESKQPNESRVPGLRFVESVITEAEEKQLLEDIDRSEWEAGPSAGGRRVQQYGFRYLYDKKYTKPEATRAFPDWLTLVAQRFVQQGYLPRLPDQAIINEYQPGQGISPHTDHVAHFAAPISSLRLGDPLFMRLEQGANGVDQWLPRRSLLVMDGDARWKWKHSINARKTDRLSNGRVHQRQRSISITFRFMRKNDAAFLLQ